MKRPARLLLTGLCPALTAAIVAGATAWTMAPVFWKLSEQCLFFDDWAGFLSVCGDFGWLAGPLRYAARGLMQFAAVPSGAVAVAAALTGAAALSLQLAFPLLRRPAGCGLALLPAGWFVAAFSLPVTPIWLLSVPEFPVFVPLALIGASLVAWGVRRLCGKWPGVTAFLLVAAVVGRTGLLVPFVDGDPEVPRWGLSRAVPVLEMESLVERGDFDGAVAHPVSRRLLRLETAYRVLANFRANGFAGGVTIPGANGYREQQSPEALMDGFKLLYHFGFVMPARRLAMELASECASEWHAVHYRYLGDIAYVCGELALAERYYRTLARSPAHRTLAKERLAAIREGRTAEDVPALKGVARLHARWRAASRSAGETFYNHGQNLEAFVYDRLDRLGAADGSACPAPAVPAKPAMRPDFLGATVPPNIAPFNFNLPGRLGAADVKAVFVAPDGETLAGACRDVRSGGAQVEDCVKVTFPVDRWHGFLARQAGRTLKFAVTDKGTAIREGELHVAAEPVDPGLVFRLVLPGYGVFGRMSVVERDLESFAERTLVDNLDSSADNRRCYNCHTPLRNSRAEFLRHRRGPGGGVRIVTKKYGDRFVRLSRPKDERGEGGVSYSAWHPSGEFAAVAVTETRQQFFLTDPAKIEVMDLQGSLALLSAADGSLRPIAGKPGDFECYPTWDPTGTLLFSCCAETAFTNLEGTVEARMATVAGAYTNMFYGLRVRRYDVATGTFAEPETVVDGNASRMSCAFPRVSPDGRWLVLTVSPYGVFPIWHKAADLWLLDLKTLKTRPIEELNSSDTESWHEFSSDGRWMVFSSRRGDGTVTRPWIARFDPSAGRFDRPFPLPLRDPDEDFLRLESCNLPTFLKADR